MRPSTRSCWPRPWKLKNQSQERRRRRRQYGVRVPVQIVVALPDVHFAVRWTVHFNFNCRAADANCSLPHDNVLLAHQGGRPRQNGLFFGAPRSSPALAAWFARVTSPPGVSFTRTTSTCPKGLWQNERSWRKRGTSCPSIAPETASKPRSWSFARPSGREQCSHSWRHVTTTGVTEASAAHQKHKRHGRAHVGKRAPRVRRRHAPRRLQPSNGRR